VRVGGGNVLDYSDFFLSIRKVPVGQGVVKHVDPRSRIGEFLGHYSARGAKFRDVMGYRLGIRPFGTDGVTAKVARGGARTDKPRGVRVLAITVGSTMAAIIFKVPPLLKGSVPCRYRTPMRIWLVDSVIHQHPE
jgi:hypothetical protein